MLLLLLVVFFSYFSVFVCFYLFSCALFYLMRAPLGWLIQAVLHQHQAAVNRFYHFFSLSVSVLFVVCSFPSTPRSGRFISTPFIVLPQGRQLLSPLFLAFFDLAF